MRGLGIEVVARAVEIHGQQIDRVEAVLGAVGLGLHEQLLLRDAVGRVRLLGIAGPEVVLAERHRRELRVRADRADRDELLEAGKPRVLHQERAHHQVLVVELAGMLPVRADAAHDCRKVDDDVRTMHVVETLDLLFVDQVEIRRRTTHDAVWRGATPEKMPHDGGAEEPGAAGNDNGLVGENNSHSLLVIGYWILVIALG